MKLDLGAGERSPEGYIPLGNINGTQIFPLPAIPDNSVDVVRASHVLEHFPHNQVPDVIKEWVRVLKPGGKLRIAVPDFKLIAEKYLSGEAIPTQSFLMGGQTDEADYHKALFDLEHLKRIFAAEDLVLHRRWESELEGDCASYDISLNLEGTKPFRKELKVSAAMSVPRLGFMDNFGSAIDGLLPLGIRLRRQGGAFWGQALTNCLETILEQDDPDAILTLDYDTIFTKSHVAHLMQLMMVYPEAHAIAPLQSSRHVSTTLFSKRGDDGKLAARVDLNEMRADLMKVSSAHFGLTLIDARKLRDLPKPWFHSVPSPNNDWREGHTDEDIYFWNKWEAEGLNLFLANRVTIGHAELMIRWPGQDLQARYQSMTDFHKDGVPKDIWR